MGAVAGLLEDAVLAARHHLDRPVAFEEPAHQIDVVGEHVEHRRGVRIALEDGEGLGARIVDPRGAADDLAEPVVPHLLLGAQEAFLVAAAVADPQIALGRMQRRRGSGRRPRARSRSAFRPAPACRAQRLQDRLGVLLLRRRHDHGGDVRMVDDLFVAAAVEIGAGLLGQYFGARGVAVRDREEPHRRMLGGEPRPQRPDAAGADHGDADIVVLLHLGSCCSSSTSAPRKSAG